MQDTERQQFEDKVHELNTSSVHKDQQLQESLSRLQDVQHQLDTAKVVLKIRLITMLRCCLIIGQRD